MAKKIKLPSIEEMLEAGVHFGHQVKRQAPQMQKYVYDVDKKVHIIDVYQTLDRLKESADFLYDIAKSGKQIIIVGTKRQASQIVEDLANDCGALFVSQRWLGGTFTNFESIKGKTERLKSLKEGMKKKEFDHYTKKERLLIDREIEKLEEFVGGISDIEKWPGAIVVIDIKRENVAVRGAQAEKIPVVGLVDTNSNPEDIDYIIPANDDGIKSIKLLLETMTNAIKQGYKDHGKEVAKDEKIEKDKTDKKDKKVKVEPKKKKVAIPSKKKVKPKGKAKK